MQLNSLEVQHRQLKAQHEVLSFQYEEVETLRNELQTEHEELKESIGSLKGELHKQSLHSTKVKIEEFTGESPHYVKVQAAPGSYKLQFKFRYIYEKIKVGIRIQPSANDLDLEWPFQGNAKVELLNQVEDKDHYTKVIPITPQHNPSRKFTLEVYKDTEKFITHTFMSSDMLKKYRDVYFLKDTAYFRITIESVFCKHWLFDTDSD